MKQERCEGWFSPSAEVFLGGLLVEEKCGYQHHLDVLPQGRLGIDIPSSQGMAEVKYQGNKTYNQQMN